MGDFQPVEDVTFVMQLDVAEYACQKRGKKVAGN